jgi:uncharacterized protein
VEIEFDPDKDRINQMKHGISLAAAADIDLDAATVIEDRRIDYGEPRFLAFAPIGGRLHVLCFTMRGNFPRRTESTAGEPLAVVRAIGLRKANRRERRRYAQTA